MSDKQSAGDRSYYRRYEECGIVYGDESPVRVRPEVEMFLGWIPSGARVVDLGCGDGSVGERIQRERQATVSGIEIDPAGAEAARRRGIEALVGDLDEGLPYHDNQFDLALINVTLHMVYRPKFVLEEALRVAPRAIVTFPNFGFWLYRLELLLGRFPKHSLYGYHWYDTRHIHMFSLADLQDCVRQVGGTIGRQAFSGLRNRRQSRLAKFWPNLFGRIGAVEIIRSGAST